MSERWTNSSHANGAIDSELVAPLEWIDSQAEHMVHLTETWSQINSGSYHADGLKTMCKALEDNFYWLKGEVQVLPLAPLQAINNKGETIDIEMGNAFRIRKRSNAPIRIFLGGHMDTVFGKDHPFQTPRYLDEHTLNGPGVADLKGGLVVMLKALEALEKSPYADQIGWEVLINPDEEIGSQCSDPLLKESAERNQLGLIYEPALSDGTLAGARKGSGNFTFVFKGKAAHAGREFDKGINAIVMASQFAVALHELNGEREGVTLNIGKVEGGGPLNMVPDLAIVRMNTRFVEADDRTWLSDAFERLMAECNGKQPESVFMHGAFTRSPKPMSDENRWLFEQVKANGALLGQDIAWKATGGCCDGNNLWGHGLPNVDTLGVRGGNIHSDQEFVVLDSLTERAKLSALLLMRLAKGEIVLPQ